MLHTTWPRLGLVLGLTQISGQPIYVKAAQGRLALTSELSWLCDNGDCEASLFTFSGEDARVLGVRS